MPLRVLTILLLAASACLAQTPAGHVILVSIDGMMPEVYAHPDQYGLKIPNLRMMVHQGCASPGAMGVMPTVTYPSHTAMVTGVQPAVHGILSNTPLDPFDKNRGGWYYYAEQIKAPAIWDVIKKSGGTVAGVNWPVTVGADFAINIPEYRPVTTDDDLALMRALSTPGIVKEVESKYGPMKPGHIDDHDRARSAAYIFGKLKPNLLMLHLIDLDHDQHYSGVHSTQAFATLEKIDSDLGLLRAEIKRLGMENDVTWIVVSDHGFRAVRNQMHARIVLRNLGYMTYDDRGILVDWRVYPWSSGGSVALVAKDPNDRAAIDRASRAFRELASDPAYGIEKIFSPSDLKKMGANPNAFLVISAADGFMFGTAIQGPLVTASPTTKGTHGYDLNLPEMRTSMIFQGKGIQACQSLPDARLIDVAPSIAALLGLPMRNIEGRSLIGAR